MRRGVQAGLVSGLRQHLREHVADRAFAVRTRDMDRFEREVGVPEQFFCLEYPVRGISLEAFSRLFLVIGIARKPREQFFFGRVHFGRNSETAARMTPRGGSLPVHNLN